MDQQTQYDLWKAGKKRKALEKKVRSLAAANSSFAHTREPQDAQVRQDELK